ncbi:MAG: glutathione S-transferase family protein [Hyphomicrobiaceae bacterium]
MSLLKLIIGNKCYSSWSLRPWIVMKAFGIPFEEMLIQLRSGDTRDRIIEHSPSGKVPALVDGDVSVWETLSILEYLADKFPAHAIWPRDAKARAHARSISAEMHSGFQGLRQACAMEVTKRFAAKERGPAVAADVARIAAIFREARAKFGASGPFLYGAFSAADGMYAPVCTRLRTYSIEIDPVSQAYVDAVLAHPAYQQWLAEAAAEPWVLGDNGNATEAVIEDLRARKA